MVVSLKIKVISDEVTVRTEHAEDITRSSYYEGMIQFYFSNGPRSRLFDLYEEAKQNQVKLSELSYFMMIRTARKMASHETEWGRQERGRVDQGKVVAYLDMVYRIYDDAMQARSVADSTHVDMIIVAGQRYDADKVIEVYEHACDPSLNNKSPRIDVHTHMIIAATKVGRFDWVDCAYANAMASQDATAMTHTCMIQSAMKARRRFDLICMAYNNAIITSAVDMGLHNAMIIAGMEFRKVEMSYIAYRNAIRYAFANKLFESRDWVKTHELMLLKLSERRHFSRSSKKPVTTETLFEEVRAKREAGSYDLELLPRCLVMVPQGFFSQPQQRNENEQELQVCLQRNV